VSTSSPSAQFFLRDESATTRLGALLAQALLAQRASIEAQGFHATVSGDLGAGKTTLVRGCLRELGVTGAVKSPTFALLEPYVFSSLNFYHFDFYRFAGPTEFGDSGFRELFGRALCVLSNGQNARWASCQRDLEVDVNDSRRSAAGYAFSPRNRIGAHA